MEMQLQTQTGWYPVKSHVSGSLASYVNSHESSFFVGYSPLEVTSRKCDRNDRKIRFNWKITTLDVFSYPFCTVRNWKESVAE